MDMKKALGKAIRQLRLDRGLTQDQVGEELDVDRGNVSRYEAGTNAPELERLEKLANFLGVSLSELFALAEGKKTQTFKPANQVQAALLQDFDLLLNDDQDRIVAEVSKLANIARAYRVKFGSKSPTDAHVATHLPTAPQLLTTHRNDLNPALDKVAQVIENSRPKVRK